MSERNYYVICDSGCRFPAMTAEQVLAAIAEATGKTPTKVNDAFITKLREGNAGANLTFWIGTTAEYNAIVAANGIVENCVYITTDDNPIGEVLEENARLREQCDTLSAENTKIITDLRKAQNDISFVYGEYIGVTDTTAPLESQADMLSYDYFTFVNAAGDTVAKFDEIKKNRTGTEWARAYGKYPYGAGEFSADALFVFKKQSGFWRIDTLEYTESETGTHEFDDTLKIYGHKYPKKEN